ncbi:MAG TPA: transcription factor FapR [Bacillota bacterium]|nr:transcription factor FapR [Bacillota bacterium]
MKRNKQERQKLLKKTIEQTPFTTDEELAKQFNVSIQTIRLDRLELGIPELRERIRSVATHEWNEVVRALPLEEVIGEIIDLELGKRAISILDIKREHVFSRNKIARGHHLFAQANSLAVAVIDDELALTATSELKFKRQVKQGERVIAKATVERDEKGLAVVRVNSFVQNEKVFTGIFKMFHSND